MTAVVETRASATPRLHPDGRTGGVGQAFICSSMLHPFTSSEEFESAWARPWLHATCNTCERGHESHDGERRCGSECRLQHTHLTSWAVCAVLRSTRMEQRRIRRWDSPAGEASKCCPGAAGHSGGSPGGGEGTICGIDEVNFPRSPLPAVAEPGHRGGVDDGIHAQPSKSKAVTWVL